MNLFGNIGPVGTHRQGVRPAMGHGTRDHCSAVIREVKMGWNGGVGLIIDYYFVFCLSFRGTKMDGG